MNPDYKMNMNDNVKSVSSFARKMRIVSFVTIAIFVLTFSFASAFMAIPLAIMIGAPHLIVVALHEKRHSDMVSKIVFNVFFALYILAVTSTTIVSLYTFAS